MGPALSILLPWPPYASSFHSFSGLPGSAGIWVCCPCRGERTRNGWQLSLWINLLSGLITKSSWDWLLWVCVLETGFCELTAPISWRFHTEREKHGPVVVILWDLLPGTVAADPMVFLGPSYVSWKRASHPALEAATDTWLFSGFWGPLCWPSKGRACLSHSGAA
jgi:hypothetical protein